MQLQRGDHVFSIMITALGTQGRIQPRILLGETKLGLQASERTG